MLTPEKFWDKVMLIASLPEAVVGYFIIFYHDMLMSGIYYMYPDIDEVSRETQLIMRTVGGYLYAFGYLCIAIFVVAIVRIIIHALLPKKGEWRVVEEELH